MLQKKYPVSKISSCKISVYFVYINKYADNTIRGHKITMYRILLILDHPPTAVDTFYVLNVDKYSKF